MVVTSGIGETNKTKWRIIVLYGLGTLDDHLLGELWQL